MSTAFAAAGSSTAPPLVPVSGALNTTGGRMSGPLGLVPVGAPTAAQQQQVDADMATLRGYGYIGDGGSHPLSGIASLYGLLNTSGWTLAQWQALLPAATALSDEIDGVAINSAIAAATGPVAIHFGATHARASHPIASCAQSVALHGWGPKVTIIDFVGSDGWDHCQGAGATDTKIEAQNLRLHSLSSGGSTYGIKATFTPDRNVELRNVEIDGFNACALFTNAAGTLIDHGLCASEIAPGSTTVGNGIEFAGTSSFVNHVRDTLVQGYAVGYRYHSTNPAGSLGLEDVSIENSAAGGAKFCIEIVADYSGYSPLEYSVRNFSCDATSGFVDAEAVSGLNIEGGDWLVDAPVGTWTGVGADFFTFKRVNSARLRDAWISNNAVVMSIGSYVHVMDSGPAPATDVKITDNKIEYQGLTTSEAMIVKDVGTTGVAARGNVFTQFFAPTVPPSNAFSWHQAATDLVSTLDDGSLAPITPEQFGAKGDGVTDDTAALNAAALAAQAVGNVLSIDKGPYLVNSGNFTIPPNAHARGRVCVSGGERAGNLYVGLPATLIVNPAYSVSVGQAATFECGIVKASTLITPTTTGQALDMVAGFSGVGVIAAGDDATMAHLLVLGFHTGIYSGATSAAPNGFQRPHIHDVLGDDTNGIVIDNAHDIARVSHAEFAAFLTSNSPYNAPLYAITGAADNGAGVWRITIGGQTQGLAYALRTGDPICIANATTQRGIDGCWTATVVDATHIDLQGSTTNVTSSGYLASGSNIVESVTTGAIRIGMTVTGGGVPSGTTVLNVWKNRIYLSQAATFTGTVGLSFASTPYQASGTDQTGRHRRPGHHLRGRRPPHGRGLHGQQQRDGAALRPVRIRLRHMLPRSRRRDLDDRPQSLLRRATSASRTPRRWAYWWMARRRGSSSSAAPCRATACRSWSTRPR